MFLPIKKTDPKSRRIKENKYLHNNIVFFKYSEQYLHRTFIIIIY